MEFSKLLGGNHPNSEKVISMSKQSIFLRKAAAICRIFT
jgi:hypothetical protein